MTLERFLRWDVDIASSSYLAEYQRRAEQRLSTALAIIQEESPNLGEVLVSLVAELPEQRILHVAFAPELEFQVRFCRTTEGKVRDLAKFLVRAFETELIPSRRENLHREPLPLDFNGPYNRGDVEKRFPAYRSITPQGREFLPGQLDQAMDLLERAAPAAAALTRSLTAIVVPISVPNLDSRYGSFSSSWYPGRTVLVNPDAALVDAPILASALLHEAIHSLIDISEIGGCLIADGAQGAALVESPWTGSLISLQSLLDAYFVWYGLLTLWCSAGNRGVVLRRRADSLIAQCERGFQVPFHEVVGAEISSVHEKTRTAIESLRVTVLSSADTRQGVSSKS